MTKFIRCIEGHVYDADQNEACPVCGAVPGVEDSGRALSDALGEKDSKTDVSNKVEKGQSEPQTKDGKVSAPVGIPRLWLFTAAAVLLLVGLAALIGLGQNDVPPSPAPTGAEHAESKTETDSSTGEPTQNGGDEAPAEDAQVEEEAGQNSGTTSDEAPPKDDSAKSEEKQDSPAETASDDETAEDADREPDNTDSTNTEDATNAEGEEDSKPTQDAEVQKLRERAIKHFTNKDYDSAIADFTDVIRRGNARWEDYNMRGMSYHNKKDLDPALADYDRAVGVPNHREFPHYNRALLLRERGDLDGALADLDAAIDEHGSKDPSHFLERADIYVLKSRFDEAIADNDRAIDLVSENKSSPKADKAFAYYMRGLSKVKKVLADPEIMKDKKRCQSMSSNKTGDKANCRYETALLIPLLDFQAAVAIYPAYAQAHSEIGWVAAEMGNYERAVESNTKAIRIRPTYSTAYSNRCLAYNDLNQRDLALADCNDAIRHAPGSARAWTARGLIYSSRRGSSNRKKAISDLRHALKIDPNFALARTILKKFGVKP